MNNLILKLKLLFLPFVLWGIGFTATYTFLHWLLILEYRILDLKNIVVEFVLPAVFTGLFVFIWLRKRLKLLKLKTKTGDLPGFFQFIALIALCIPAVVAQHYIVTATGKLVQVENINQIGQQKLSRYYTVEDYYLDKANVQIFPYSEVSGKNNQYLNFYLHAVVPILGAAADTISTQPIQGWLGVKFSHQVSNRLSPQGKEAAYQKFMQESWEEFQVQNTAQFQYLDRIGSSTDLDKYRTAVKGKSSFYTTSEPVILVPVHQPYAARNGNKLSWIFGSFGIGSAVWLLMISLAKFRPFQLKKFLAGKPQKDTELQEFFSIFIPKKDYVVTPLILDLNLLLFILMTLSGAGFLTFESEDLLSWGANFKPLVLEGDWWRLMTNVFLHGGIMHLVMNMAALLFVGSLLEPYLGKVKFAVLYLTLGLAASLTSIWWYDRTISVGASGAIFGLYGFVIALLTVKALPGQMNKSLLITSGLFVAINLVMGLAGAGIDNGAHIGGLAAGLTAGFGYYLSIYNQHEDYLEPEEEQEKYTSA
ncbi:rhomboid family intramembrane serine protease [Pontibacter harenae]|uniref:rhomboid family intramembrane serine protease n=1 Tax=Pontibacter harenae TaxID=2894083 RepID=UPI001E4CF54A|nr:rhomboid family intramembrane serine protease [Pontibacter harenae]MCC9166400.1 rhomboid family intramembrane serine protease [Pontibacter harenae]